MGSVFHSKIKVLITFLAIYSLTPSLLSNGGSNAAAIAKQKEAREADSTDLESGDQAKQKLAHELAELEPEKQNELNEKIQKKAGSFPIPMALGILILWILLSAGLFCIWETEWGYLTSVYFFFVSISTVGLGDIIPTKPDMMLVNFMLILVGLALLSMCINLIQEALERLIDQLIDEYIDEIEKIAAVVTNHEEFGDEATTPFEVGMTDFISLVQSVLMQQQSSTENEHLATAFINR
uniref:Potassium channel domain-containing protein n=1 Tax=Ditylenchus dipsaci TaxID=166011 RepID=A0A915D069_9BILA